MIILTDIHGNFDTMMALLDKIPKSERDKGIVVAGDLVDRGPKSRDVVQFCIDNNVDVVKGNHEEMMIAETNKDGTPALSFSGIWAPNGGFETLKSYHIEPEEDEEMNWAPAGLHLDHKTIENHRKWMENLPYYLEFKDVKNDNGEYLLVTHSSASRVWKWDDQRRKEQWKHFVANLTWGRPHRIDPIPGVFNVFGHTPIANGPRIKKCYANIDTGCFFNGQPGFYTLTALQFPEMIVYQQKNIDRK